MPGTSTVRTNPPCVLLREAPLVRRGRRLVQPRPGPIEFAVVMLALVVG